MNARLTFFFFFKVAASSEIYALSLHDALPICDLEGDAALAAGRIRQALRERFGTEEDRKSTRLNSSHGYISYAVFCLKKKSSEERTADVFQFDIVYSLVENH